jgi:cytochrome P450
LTEYLGGVIEKRRQQPGTDLISTMIAANEDQERMTDSEIVSQCSLILVAGNVTTSDLIANGIKALLKHREQLAALRAQPELIVNAVEEVLRYESPAARCTRGKASPCRWPAPHLARVETQEAILALIQRFPSLSLVEQEFMYRPVPSFRALTQLWVRRE